jgi:hypothetical protein
MFISKPLPGEKGARLAFGLEWRAYDVARSGEQRRRYAAELLATHYVETKVGNETVGGFCAPEKGELSGARLYSAAARIAALERVRTLPAVLVLIEHESKVLTVFVVRGAVRSDEVLTLQAAHGRRTEIAKLCARNGWSLAVFGAGEGIGQLDAPVGLHELMADRKAGRIAKLPVRLGGSMVALGVVGATLFVVFKGWDMISPPPPAPAPKSYQDLYHEAVVAEFGQGQPLASALAPDLLAQLGRMETNRAGWQFKSAECDNRGACRVKWNREGGTFVDFDLAAPKDWRPIQFRCRWLEPHDHRPRGECARARHPERRLAMAVVRIVEGKAADGAAAPLDIA